MMLLELMLMAAKVGLTAFGGGLATIAIFSYELVATRGWFTPEEFTQMVAVCQSFPGPVAVNISTFVGYKMGGVLGAVVATFSIIAAPLSVLISVLWVFSHSTGKTKEYVLAVQKALRPSVGALLFVSLFMLVRPLVEKPMAWVLMGMGGLMIYFIPFVRKNPQIALLASALGALFLMNFLSY